MPEETTIYEDPQVKITNLRAVIEGKTYPIANITSVGATSQSPSGCLPGIGFLFGLMLFLFGIADMRENIGSLIIGIMVAAPSAYVLIVAKPFYILQLATAAGEVKALQSKDQQYIAQITEALNQAIIQKG